MKLQVYRVLRDLHLYSGLFLSPFVLVFALSVFFLVHAWLPGLNRSRPSPRTVTDLPLPANLEALSGRPLIDALRPALAKAQVDGEVGWVQHSPAKKRFVVPVAVPGRVTTVTIDLAKREATIERHDTGLADALVMLHKSPGPHLANIRMNWLAMRVWRWLADATVYLVFFLTVSGIYLWAVLRAERKMGLALLVAGTLSFFGIVYAVCR